MRSGDIASDVFCNKLNVKLMILNGIKIDNKVH